MRDDEARQLRARREDEARRLDRIGRGGSRRTPLVVGKIFAQSALPTTTDRFFAAHPTIVTGANAEGVVATLTPDTGSTIYLGMLGSNAPAAGDCLIGYSSEYRLIAIKSGAGTPTGTGIVFGCPCTNMPNTLQVHRANPPSPGVDSTLMDATLAFGPRPSDLSLYASDIPGYYSTSVLASTLTGYFKFRYWLACDQGFYSLRGLITPDSPVSYPGTFIICYFLAGLPGNTCSPFNMLNFSTQNNEYRLEGPTITS